jgi:murein DD-endopeptidase MepM/ murein hydrolase activator NlpD
MREPNIIGDDDNIDDDDENEGIQEPSDTETESDPIAENEARLKQQLAMEKAAKKQAKKNDPNSAKNRAKDAAKKAVKDAIKEVWKKIPLKAKLIIIAVIAAVIILVIVACVLYAIMNQNASTITAAPDNFSIVLPETSKLGREYKNTNSLINFELKKKWDEQSTEENIVTIDGLYEYFMNQKDPKEYQELLNDMQNKRKDGNDSIVESTDFGYDKNACKEGTVICVDTKRGAISPNEERETYKHLLMTDKYNFNAIKWHGYHGDHKKGTVVDEKIFVASDPSQISVNKKTGLQYPTDPDMLETDFTSGYLKYLQNWSIPLSMYVGSIKSGEKGYTQNGSFAYQIVSKAMSDVGANRYKVDQRELVKEKIVLSYADVSRSIYDFWGHLVRVETKTIPVSVTRGYYDKNEILTSVNQYRLSYAKTFDLNIENEYLYIPYNVNDPPHSTRVDSFGYSEPYSEGEWSGTAYGTRYEKHEFWKDTFELTRTQSETVKKDDIKEFSGGTYSDNEEKYYSEYEQKNVNGRIDSQLDRVMMINSKKDIYTKYMQEKDAFDEHVGYTRMFLDSSYSELRKRLSAVAGQYVYGHSLGIDASASSDGPGDIGGNIPVEIPEGGIAWPVPASSTISYLYGSTLAYGAFHYGIDISSGGHTTKSGNLTVGPQIIAVGDGTVTVMGKGIRNDGYLGNSDNGGAGNFVRIKLDSGKYTVIYMHLSYVADGLEVGSKVKAGDVIGTMGTTGNSTGTHLHFQIEFGARVKVDPLGFYNTSPEYGSFPDRYVTPVGLYKYVSSKTGTTK